VQFVRFLVETPVAAILLLLVLLITIVPFVAGWLSRKKAARSGSANAPPKELAHKPFLGTQLDLAILILGFLLVLVLIERIYAACCK
jgi:uncharacterized iron-regulated membrane protein